VEGDIAVGFAAGGEDFTPLGEPDVTEHPRPGEVIYADAKSVLTRHWNHRDADRTKVTEESTRIVFLLETTGASDFGPLLEAAAAKPRGYPPSLVARPAAGCSGGSSPLLVC
jgi:DNA/RNA-binding domain of Phe-tRNA-synthetase-like protein